MSILNELGFDDELENRSLLGGIISGVRADFEEVADAFLRHGRQGVTALSDKKDYLTTEQMALRQQREVLNGNGYPDPSIKQGYYRRSYNPLAGMRPCRSAEEW